METPPMSSVNLLEGLSRTVVYMTHNQLLNLVSSLFPIFIRHLLENKLLIYRCKLVLHGGNYNSVPFVALFICDPISLQYHKASLFQPLAVLNGFIDIPAFYSILSVSKILNLDWDRCEFVFPA